MLDKTLDPDKAEEVLRDALHDWFDVFETRLHPSKAHKAGMGAAHDAIGKPTHRHRAFLAWHLPGMAPVLKRDTFRRQADGGDRLDRRSKD